MPELKNVDKLELIKGYGRVISKDLMSFFSSGDIKVPIICACFFAFCILMIICRARILHRVGNKWWKALIPIWGKCAWAKSCTGFSKWAIFQYLPILNIISAIYIPYMMFYNIFGVESPKLMTFFYIVIKPIVTLIVAFDKSYDTDNINIDYNDEKNFNENELKALNRGKNNLLENHIDDNTYEDDSDNDDEQTFTKPEMPTKSNSSKVSLNLSDVNDDPFVASFPDEKKLNTKKNTKNSKNKKNTSIIKELKKENKKCLSMPMNSLVFEDKDEYESENEELNAKTSLNDNQSKKTKESSLNKKQFKQKHNEDDLWDDEDDYTNNDFEEENFNSKAPMLIDEEDEEEDIEDNIESDDDVFEDDDFDSKKINDMFDKNLNDFENFEDNQSPIFINVNTSKIKKTSYNTNLKNKNEKNKRIDEKENGNKIEKKSSINKTSQPRPQQKGVEKTKKIIQKQQEESNGFENLSKADILTNSYVRTNICINGEPIDFESYGEKYTFIKNAITDKRHRILVRKKGDQIVGVNFVTKDSE